MTLHDSLCRPRSSSLAREGLNEHSIAAGVLASGDNQPVTVAAQRWTHTSFHLYALASGPTGHRDDDKVGSVQWYRDYNTGFASGCAVMRHRSHLRTGYPSLHRTG